MKKIITLALSCMLLAAPAANAQSLSDLLGGLLGGNSSSDGNKAGGSSTLGNLLEGVFSRSDISVADLAGVWTVNGPAVCFQSDNLLKKAGGIAAASAIEQKLSPYYQQYGLNGAVFTIQKDGTFTMQLKKLTLKGTITQLPEEKGCFEFAFTTMGIKTGAFKCYAQKSFSTLSLMFDATKLKTLLSTVAKLTGMKMATTISGILDGYEGLCVGFRLESSGTVPGQNSGTVGGSKSDSTTSSPGAGLGTLLDILNNRKKQ